MFFKVIACEIAVREICHVSAQSPHLVELEFLNQGLHDHPAQGREEIQKRIDAAPAGRFDAILIGYALCSSILTRLTTAHTPLIIPRAHDCITFFLGSKERYQTCFMDRPGTYYFTSGWLECRQRRGDDKTAGRGGFMPSQSAAAMEQDYQAWVEKYGEEQAKYLSEVMTGWTEHYTHGTLIDFDFTKPLRFDDRVKEVCRDKGWQYEELPGDLGLLRRWLNGEWDPKDFLVVPPGRTVIPTFDEQIIGLAPQS